MITIDDRDLRRFESDLKTFAIRAYPFATKQTVNKSAFQAQKIARKGVRKNLVLRNKFTVQSIQVDPARTLQVSRQEALVGSIAAYMEDQEFGAIKKRRGRIGVPIPTGFSAGQEGKRPRTRLPISANRLRAIRFKRSKKKKQSIAAVIKQNQGKFVFLDLKRTQGIFKVFGGRLKMVHDLSKDFVKVPKRPWLKPAVDVVGIQIPEVYRDALIFQLKRQRLFRG